VNGFQIAKQHRIQAVGSRGMKNEVQMQTVDEVWAAVVTECFAK